jgi:hypothetical protein
VKIEKKMLAVRLGLQIEIVRLNRGLSGGPQTSPAGYRGIIDYPCSWKCSKDVINRVKTVVSMTTQKQMHCCSVPGWNETGAVITSFGYQYHEGITFVVFIDEAGESDECQVGIPINLSDEYRRDRE